MKYYTQILTINQFHYLSIKLLRPKYDHKHSKIEWENDSVNVDLCLP